MLVLIMSNLYPSVVSHSWQHHRTMKMLECDRLPPSWSHGATDPVLQVSVPPCRSAPQHLPVALRGFTC